LGVYLIFSSTPPGAWPVEECTEQQLVD